MIHKMLIATMPEKKVKRKQCFYWFYHHGNVTVMQCLKRARVVKTKRGNVTDRQCLKRTRVVKGSIEVLDD